MYVRRAIFVLFFWCLCLCREFDFFFCLNATQIEGAMPNKKTVNAVKTNQRIHTHKHIKKRKQKQKYNK